MGPRVMRRLPKFVHGFIDRHGKPRFYFRRPGFESVPLQGLPYSVGFMRAYDAALAGQPRPPATRAGPGTMAALALSYFGSPQFNALRSSSQYVYRRTIERFGKDHGDKRAADMRRDHVVKLMSRLAEKRHAANTLRRALRNLMRHAIDIGLRADDPTRDVKAIRIKSSGHHSWTDAEIEQFERCHPVGSPAGARAPALYRTASQRRHPHGGTARPWRRPTR
jgi:hypothetical protein